MIPSESVEHERALLRATTDAMIDPHALAEAVRDPDGTIVDFTFRQVNPAACEYLQRSREGLTGASMIEVLPDIESSGLFAGYVHCVRTGEPVTVEDFTYFSRRFHEMRWYDFRAARAGADWLSMTWRDVTQRHLELERVVEYAERFRLLAENSSDVLMHVRDGAILWVSPSVEEISGYSPADLLGRNVTDFFSPESRALEDAALAESLARRGSLFRRLLLVNADGTQHWNQIHATAFVAAGGEPDGVIVTLRRIDDQVAAERSGSRFRRLITHSIVPIAIVAPDGPFLEANQAMCDFFGYDMDTMLTKTPVGLSVPENRPEVSAVIHDLITGRRDSYRAMKPYLHADGHRIWGDISVTTLRRTDGSVEYGIVQIVDMTDDVAAREKLAQAHRRQAEADDLYRRSMDSAAVGMCPARPEGAFIDVNDALCRFFGYDAETLMRKTWIELTAPDYLQADLDKVADMVAGRIESYRMIKQFIHADGHPIWGDLSVGCLRGPSGGVEISIGQIIDITEEVQTRQRLALQEQRTRAMDERLRLEVSSAADYVRSILPADLVGPVPVSSHYLPSQELGGDCFNYTWLDDDHLAVYLIDVSGHGVRPALLSMSIHNLLRSGTVANADPLEPDQVLSALNGTFDMDDHSGHYFTIWYGVYQPSTRLLRYASAGHPPALALTSPGGPATVTQLSAMAPPIGMFADTRFRLRTFEVPPASHILIYSDGAFDFRLSEGNRLSHDEFVARCARQAAVPDWSLGTFVESLQQMTIEGHFEDDCAMILLDIA